MKIASAVLAAALFAGLAWVSSAGAQGVPPGSYRQSCTEIRIERGALVATCRSEHGRAVRSALADVGRCVGDIGNNNGVLQCDYPNGPARASVVPGPGYAAPSPPAPGYGAPPYGAPAPGYGPPPGYNPPPQYGEEARERCFALHREAERLRDRLRDISDPYERGRLEGRLHEVHEQEERCR